MNKTRLRHFKQRCLGDGHCMGSRGVDGFSHRNMCPHEHNSSVAGKMQNRQQNPDNNSKLELTYFLHRKKKDLTGSSAPADPGGNAVSWSETQQNKETMKPDKATRRQLLLDWQSMPPAPHKSLIRRSIGTSSVDLTTGKMLRDHELKNARRHPHASSSRRKHAGYRRRSVSLRSSCHLGSRLMGRQEL